MGRFQPSPLEAALRWNDGLHIIRSIALHSTGGLARSTAMRATAAPISVPVGPDGGWQLTESVAGQGIDCMGPAFTDCSTRRQ